MSMACKAKGCGRTGRAMRRRSKVISSATSINPRMPRRGGRSATSRSSALARRRPAPASSRRSPRKPFCRLAPPRRHPQSLLVHLGRLRRLPARRPPNRQVRRRQPRPETHPARPSLRPAPALPIRCAASAPEPASPAARDPAFRSAADAAPSANSPPGAPARIQAAPRERRRSGQATSAATAVRSIPPPTARRRAAAARLSMAAVCHKRRTVRRDRRTRVALSAPPAMFRPGAPAASPAR